MTAIGFVSCVSQKRDRPCAAQDMYISPLFKKSRHLIELRTSRLFILSAKYGLLVPTQVIEPYEVTLKNMKRQQIDDWAALVRHQVQAIAYDHDLVVLAGSLYLRAFEGVSNKVITPLGRLPIGKRLQRLASLGA